MLWNLKALGFYKGEVFIEPRLCGYLGLLWLIHSIIKKYRESILMVIYLKYLIASYQKYNICIISENFLLLIITLVHSRFFPSGISIVISIYTKVLYNM